MAEQDPIEVPISDAMRMAVEHQQAGRLDSAESIYRAVLESEPNHAGAKYNLALIALQGGRPGEAVAVLREAVAADPDNAALWMNYAVALAGNGDTAAAREVLRQARGRGLESGPLVDLLARIEQMSGASAPAVIATVTDGQRGPGEAINLTLLERLGRQGRYAELERTADPLTRQFPESGPLWRLLGLALLAQNKSEQARESFERASALLPGDAATLNLLGVTLRRLQRSAEAVDVLRRAVERDARKPEYRAELANALLNLGRAEEARQEAQRALDLRPDHVQANLSMARSLYELGQTSAARRHYRAASDGAPQSFEVHSAYLFCLIHDETVTAAEAYAEHVRIGDLIEQPLRAAWRPHDNDRDPERDLRIGFVSADLRDHPVAYLIEPVWQAIKLRRHQVFAYAHLPGGEDAVSARLRGLTDAWVRVEQMRDDALCARIRADRIDILVDLSGHTTYNRLTAFARRPAPIQVSWIGYPATTGLTAIDYRFLRGVDVETNRLFRERVVRFGGRGFLPEASAPPVGPLPALDERVLTFGSFNRPGKIGEAVIELWCRVLRAVPQSRLLIAAAGEAQVQERMRASFVSHGIAAERLTFRPRMAMPQYLALHNEVDIALDTFPYTGGTTTSHALWMGVPVLTFAGPGLHQQQAASTLVALGLADWVAVTEEAFVRRAALAASHLEQLAELRAGLRERMQRLFGNAAERNARELDAAFRTIWRRWCAGLPAEDLTVEL